MKINLKRDRLTGILLVAMMFVGMNVSAQRIRVQGHITNPQGKSVPNVNVLNPVNDERIEMSDEDGRYSVAFCWKFQCKMLFGFRKHLTLDFPTVKRSMIPDLPSLFT